MSERSSHHFLLIGLPSTGKTSFLAALWYMVNQSDTDCALALDKLDGDSRYLNQIRDSWLEYKPVPRNPLDSEKAVAMLLKVKDSGALVKLNVPDLSGESFRLQWAHRQFTTQYDERLQEAGGAVLFVYPEGMSKPHRIDTLKELEAAMGQAGTEQDTAEEDAVNPKPWDIEKAPTQVQLVELLQFILGRDYFRPPFRLAIVVSAWDLVSGLGKSPEEWVSSELPLLRQFLGCNSEMFTVEFYGVSAQGGRYASSLLTAENFKDAKAFVESMSQKRHDVAGWLWEQIDPATQGALQEKEQASEAIGSILARSLNELMAKSSIYDEERFKGVKLRSESKEILKNSVTVQMGEESIRLNRLLLEDVYPSDLIRTRQYADEATALQKKKPGRRIVLVGSKVKNAHDITEPVQWLMQ